MVLARNIPPGRLVKLLGSHKGPAQCCGFHSQKRVQGCVLQWVTRNKLVCKEHITIQHVWQVRLIPRKNKRVKIY